MFIDVFLLLVFLYLTFKKDSVAYMIGLIISIVVLIVLVKIPSIKLVKFEKWKKIYPEKLENIMITEERGGFLNKRIIGIEYLTFWLKTKDGYGKVYIEMPNVFVKIDNNVSRPVMFAPICVEYNPVLKHEKSIICPDKKFKLIINEWEFENGDYF